jgi:DNA-binding transcriptional MerR regulator
VNAAGRARSWPQGLDQEATLSISGVLDALRPEFGGLTISKLRYLEDQGLLAPKRTASGYRRYSAADVERVAWVLVQQRDHFLPLKVIRDRLAALDGALAWEEPAPRRLREAGRVAGQASAPEGFEALAAEFGVRAAPDDPALAGAARAVADLAAFGIELRHLRPLIQSVRRKADLAQVAAAAQRSPGAAGEERARLAALECADSIARLEAALMRLMILEPPARRA